MSLKVSKVLFARLIVIFGLISALVYYIIYTSFKFQSQPTLIRTLNSIIPNALPIPGLIICCHNPVLEVNVTSGPPSPPNTDFTVTASRYKSRDCQLLLDNQYHRSNSIQL